MKERLGRLPAQLRLAGMAAAGLVVSLLLPWYGKSYLPAGAREFATDDLSAFGVFSWVEAAILVVAAAVLGLVWARSERRAVALPGGDGPAIIAAGVWAILLLAWRLFDRPDVEGPGATVGLQWGMLVALVAAGALTVAGVQARRAEPTERPAADPPRAPRR